MAHILVVDDDKDLCALLRTALERDGHQVSTRLSGREVDESACRWADCILLDVMMPEEDGFALCRRIREHLACPIIFLTARVEDADQLDGFAAGGDDYVLKPFSLAVLGGRVRAHLAREARRPPQAESVRIFSEVTVDFGRRAVTVRPAGSAAPVSLELTRTEFDIIALLSKNPGRVYDRTQIYERLQHTPKIK